MKYVWLVVSVLGLASVACTRRNPAVCCVSAADCTEISLPVGSLCGNGQACLDHACIDPQCHSSADCSGATPICHDGVCGACDSANPCPASSPVCDVDHGTCGGCGDNTACAAFPTMHTCEVSTGMCVDCLARSDCAGATPICDAKVCRGCETHADCPGSDACLPDGACGTDADTAYVSQTGTDNATCVRATPCATIAAGLATMKPNLKLTGSFTEEVTISRGVSIVSAPGTRITSSNSTQIATIQLTTSADVAIEDLEISGSRSIGLTATQGTLTAVRLKVFGNGAFGMGVASLVLRDSVIANNRFGGLTVKGDLSITNSIISANGDGSINDTIGGLLIGSGFGTRVVRFTTIANNVINSSTSSSPGIDCGFGVVVSESNIVLMAA